MSTLATLIQHSIGRHSQSNQARKRDVQIRKEEVKLLLFVDDLVLYTESPKDSSKKLLEIIYKYSKLIV